MNISSRCDYACRAVVELARHAHTAKPLTATAIAGKRNIPEKYLVHILLQLKKVGIVRSVRGARGGYLLGKPADSISLLDVIVAVDGAVLDPLPSMDPGSEDLAVAWQEAAKDLEEVLQAVSVQSILENSAKSEMYFI